jgi:hypothetical protein
MLTTSCRSEGRLREIRVGHFIVRSQDLPTCLHGWRDDRHVDGVVGLIHRA